MSTLSKAEGSRKGKKLKEPLMAAQVVINRREDEFQQLFRNFQFPVNWEATFPSTGSTAVDVPPGFITLYSSFFKVGLALKIEHSLHRPRPILYMSYRTS
ncbi:hypothetical protein Hanom_Chr07g00597051 [Helianthus anomalus]